jgi:gluconolactonase
MTGVRVLADGLRFPEGPAFAPDGALWGVELQGGCLFRLDAAGAFVRVPTGGAPNGLAFDRTGRPWFCDADRGQIRRLDPDGTARVMADTGDGHLLDRPNDLALDPGGTLVFTCPGNSRTEPTGTVWSRAADGTVAPVASGLQFPNGRIAGGLDVPGERSTNVALDPSGRYGLVVTDAERGRLLSFPDVGPGAGLFCP